MAAEYRATFGSEVVVDLIGYRRHGHSEVDDPRLRSRYFMKNQAPSAALENYAERTGINPSAR